MDRARLGNGAIVMNGKTIVGFEAGRAETFASLRGSDWLDEHDELTKLHVHDGSPIILLVSPLPKNPLDL